MKTNEDRKIGYAKQLRHALRKEARKAVALPIKNKTKSGGAQRYVSYR